MPIDYAKYPPDWKTRIRPAVLERAQDKCEFCGVANGEIGERIALDKFRSIDTDELAYLNASAAHYKQPLAWVLKKVGLTKIVLTVAHLDHDVSNHAVSLDRLRALCQSCHLAYDNPRHIANRKLTQHGRYAKGHGYFGVGKLF